MSSNPQQPTVPAAPVPNTSSILEALANMARQNTTAAAAAASVPAPSSSYSIPPAQSNPAHQLASMNLPFSFPPSTQSVNVPAPAATFAPQAQGINNSAQNFPSNAAGSYGSIPPFVPQETNAALQQQISLCKTLAEQGIPQDQWVGIIAALNAVQGGGIGAGVLSAAQLPASNQSQIGWGARPEESRDRNGYHEPVRSPPGRYRRRSRSPSPARAWGARDSPSSRRRDEPGYGDYDRGRDSPRGRGNDYRQRSPPGRRGRSPSPANHGKGQMGRGEKWVDYDPTIGKENIKGIMALFMMSYHTLMIYYSFEPHSICRWCHVGIQNEFHDCY
jgi:protein NRD1